MREALLKNSSFNREMKRFYFSFQGMIPALFKPVDFIFYKRISYFVFISLNHTFQMQKRKLYKIIFFKNIIQNIS